MPYVIGTEEWADAWCEAVEVAGHVLASKITRYPDLVQRIQNMPFEDVPDIGLVPDRDILYALVDDIQQRFDALNWFAHGRPHSDEELIREMGDIAAITYIVVDLYHPDKTAL